MAPAVLLCLGIVILLITVDATTIQFMMLVEIGTRDPAEMRHIQAAREQIAIDIGKGIGPSGQPGTRPIIDLCVHGTEQFADHLMGIAPGFREGAGGH
jgi:hypothetical protein